MLLVKTVKWLSHTLPKYLPLAVKSAFRSHHKLIIANKQIPTAEKSFQILKMVSERDFRSFLHTPTFRTYYLIIIPWQNYASRMLFWLMLGEWITMTYRSTELTPFLLNARMIHTILIVLDLSPFEAKLWNIRSFQCAS